MVTPVMNEPTGPTHQYLIPFPLPSFIRVWCDWGGGHGDGNRSVNALLTSKENAEAYRLEMRG